MIYPRKLATQLINPAHVAQLCLLYHSLANGYHFITYFLQLKGRKELRYSSFAFVSSVVHDCILVDRPRTFTMMTPGRCDSANC
jgi:hypothetical protein